MIQTKVQLPNDEYNQLRRAALRQKRSIAACVREGIRLFLNRFRSSEADIEKIAGKFRPLPATDLKAHDRWIADAIKESKSVGRGR